MKYEVPSIEVELLNIEDIVRTSLTDGGMGDNDGVGGDGSKPWEQSKDIEKKGECYEKESNRNIDTDHHDVSNFLL